MAKRAQLGKTYDSWALVFDEQERRRLADECCRVVAPIGQDATAITLDLQVRCLDVLTDRLQ